MKTLMLLLMLTVPVAARADIDYCLPLPFQGVLPVTRAQQRQCTRESDHIFRALRRLCRQYPGTAICERFIGDGGRNAWIINPGWLLYERFACLRPVPTFAECCAAHVPLLVPETCSP